MGAIILATLLEAAPADARAEFEHLGSCVLGDLAAAQAGALLEGLSSDRQGLWTACKNAGISRKQGGRSLQQEELRALAKDKLLAVLPAVSFQALLDIFWTTPCLARWGGNWKSTERSSWRRRKRPE